MVEKETEWEGLRYSIEQGLGICGGFWRHMHATMCVAVTLASDVLC